MPPWPPTLSADVCAEEESMKWVNSKKSRSRSQDAAAQLKKVVQEHPGGYGATCGLGCVESKERKVGLGQGSEGHGAGLLFASCTSSPFGSGARDRCDPIDDQHNRNDPPLARNWGNPLSVKSGK